MEKLLQLLNANKYLLFALALAAVISILRSFIGKRHATAQKRAQLKNSLLNLRMVLREYSQYLEKALLEDLASGSQDIDRRRQICQNCAYAISNFLLEHQQDWLSSQALESFEKPRRQQISLFTSELQNFARFQPGHSPRSSDDIAIAAQQVKEFTDRLEIMVDKNSKILGEL